MKKITLITAIAMIAITANSFGQETATGTSTTAVVAAISIAMETDLAFGNVTENGSGGTITIPAESGAVATGGGGALPVAGTPVSAGSFTVTGEAGKVFDITLAGTTATLIGVVVTNLIEVTGLETSAATGTIGQPTATFYVGGIITLAATQIVDTYTGTYDVTVQYQ